jgi:geranylgeranyl diphosphate synthase type I
MSNEYLTALDQVLRDITAPHGPGYAELYNMLHYHLGWTDRLGNVSASDPGKRIRPLVCLWSCEAVAGSWREALPAAAAVELLHNFSLIHDDIQDDSSERRGRETVWKVWGLAQGLNAGDAMFVMAQLALGQRQAAPVDSGSGLGDRVSEGDAARLFDVHRAFNLAALELTQGQYLDLAYERATDVTVDGYFRMIRGKTAALIRASAQIGARIATDSPIVVSRFADYGENLGIAFQLADDILGLWGDPEVTGKSARTDLVGRKKSYPVVAALAVPEANELRALYARKEWTEGDLFRVEQLLSESNVRQEAAVKAAEYGRRALDALESTSLDNDAITRLRKLVNQIVDRQK